MYRPTTSKSTVIKPSKVRIAQLIVMLFCFSFFSVTIASVTNKLEKIQFASMPGNKVQIELKMDGAPQIPKSFSTDNPARIAIDLLGVSNKAGKKALPINIGNALSVRAVEAGGRTRVVVNLSASTAYSTKVEGDSVYITLLNMSPSNASAEQAIPTSDGLAVEKVDFRRGSNGEGRVLVSLSGPNAIVDVQENGGKVTIDLKNTSLPPRLANRLDVLDFATPVEVIDVMPHGDSSRLVITPTGAYDFLSYQMDELLTIEFKPLTKKEQEDILADKFPYTGEKLSLNFQSIEVRSVLQLLADFTDMNLVASDSVGGSVTLRLNNVPWDQALDIILKSKGLSKRIKGNVMIVGPTNEIARQERDELTAKKQVTELSPLVSEFIEINYAKAADISTLLKSGGNGLLSSRGGVTVDDRTNTLLVQETVEKLAEIRKIIQRLDKPVRQVMIESRIVIANDDFTRDLGVRFGLEGTDQQGTVPNSGSFVGVGGALPNTVMAPGFGVAAPSALMVDLAASNPAGAAQFVLGKIGNSLLQLELSALQTEAKGEVISSPRVVTSDQTQATISQGIEIPYQEASSSGATSTSFQEALLELEVTPHITPDDRINMELSISKDEADRSFTPPAINKQEVETTVLVNNGDTVILGGIYERTTSNGVKKVPFFGDLPGVGVLFKNTTKSDNNRELLFFITPKILKDNLSVN